ncbi:MAG TPA: RNA pseudouridine synthase [Acetobacteraceae bacterium]|nr:RNA pseudouridine synthase [Acetobacteraceae bacterium]
MRAALPELFRDSRFVVLNKPAGLAVHPGPRGGPSVEDFFPILSRRRNGPWLAHRLDADTAGCLVVALTKSALIAAQAEFAAGRAEKTYWAVVRGAPAQDGGTIAANLRKVTSLAGWHMDIDPAGQPAVTDWRVLGRGDGMSLLEVRPRTGRTHQVRVHCVSLGCPIIGDALYGGGEGSLQLLARAITLRLDPVVSAVAPVPEYMAVLVRKNVLF